MELTPVQNQACQSLKDILSGQKIDATEDTEWLLDGGDASVILNDDELEDLDDEEYEDLVVIEDEFTEEQSSSSANAVERCILDLLVSLFAHLPSGQDDKFYSPIYRFVILFSLNKNGKWLAGRRITQVFAALLFCGREVMMALMNNEIVQRPSLRYSEYVAH
jgi:hypothetical protein